MKIIPKITPIDQLEGKLGNFAPHLSFSIFSSNNNYLTIAETANLYKQNKNIPIIDLVSFKSNRILDHEIIIALTTSIKLINLTDDLTNKFKLVQSLIDNKSFDLKANLIRQEMLAKYNMLEAIQKTNKILKTIAKDIVASAIIKSNLELLTNHPLDQRITTTVNGPIASGKGLFKSSLMQLDSIKINGDSYKTILNAEYLNRNSPIELSFFSQLVQEEIHYLCREINKRLLEKIISQHQAPNVYLDKSIINQQAIDIATVNGGEIKAILISLPVSEAIKRSEIRGNETGRFEDTHEILNAHNSIAIKLTDLLIKNVGKNITYSLYDNDIDMRTPPLKTSEINLNTKKITIYNEVKFFELLNKSNLDIEESIKQQKIIYDQENTITGCDLVHDISLSGYNIEPALSIC